MFCKAALLALIFECYTLLALSGLAVVFYILAIVKGQKEWSCWAKPPWVVPFWLAIFLRLSRRFWGHHA